jgi:glycosyltransferase involved in cell wall biosynthesis
MACGLPIIASEIAGCVPDLVENAENGFVVPSGNVEELARAMRTLLSNPSLAREMGASSALRIQAFTPEACADGFSRAVAFACADPRMGTELEP